MDLNLKPSSDSNFDRVVQLLSGPPLLAANHNSISLTVRQYGLGEASVQPGCVLASHYTAFLLAASCGLLTHRVNLP